MVRYLALPDFYALGQPLGPGRPAPGPRYGPAPAGPGPWPRLGHLACWVRYLAPAPAPGPQHLYVEVFVSKFSILVFVTKFSESIAFDFGSKNSDIAVSNANCLFIHSENFRGSNTSKLLRTFISSSL